MPRNHKKKKKKAPKEKVTYYDDGSTIADMSNVTAPGERRRDKNKNPPPRSTARDKWNTYWSTTKKMVLPMLVVLAVMTATFLVILYACSY